MDGAGKTNLLTAYRRILRPLVRILLRFGVGYGEFSEVAKAAYVEVAATDFEVPGKKTTQARVAVLTGLTRKDVARVIKNSGEPPKADQAKLGRVVRVITGWHADSEFTGPYGLPRELKFDSGGRGDFVSLVRRYSGDMPARAVLDELIRVKAVEEIDNAWFRILTRNYSPNKMAPEYIDRLSTTVEQFIDTVDYNLTKKKTGQGRFERKVESDNGLFPEDLPSFDAFLKERGQQFLEELDNWFASRRRPSEKRGDEIVKTGIGVYHFIDRNESEVKLTEIFGGENEKHEKSDDME